jgi:hypothetical protein
MLASSVALALMLVPSKQSVWSSKEHQKSKIKDKNFGVAAKQQ